MVKSDKKCVAVSGELVIILVEPQLGDNIGSAARAMANFGLSEMRLVSPCDGWLNQQTYAMASGAADIVDAAKVYSALGDAIADLHFVYASTARPRDMRKPVIDVADALRDAHARSKSSQRVAVLFGRERWGLNNDEITLANEIITLPANPSFSSFNLGQAVLLVGYEWFRAKGVLMGREDSFYRNEMEPSTRRDMIHLFEHLEHELTKSGFFFPPEKMPSMVRNLRNLLHRLRLNKREVSMLHGIISALVTLRSSGSWRKTILKEDENSPG